MKINFYQKIIIILYSIFFIYFSIIHVPFKIYHSSKIKYDTIFSDNSDIDVSRLVLIIVIISILSGVIFLLSSNLKSPNKLKLLPKQKFKLTPYNIKVNLLVLIIISVIIFTIIKNSGKPRIDEFNHHANEQNKDSTSTMSADTSRLVAPHVSDTTINIDKALACNEENALSDFKSYMKFYYPDWKIYGKPVVREQSDCTYRIQFTTRDPHIPYFPEKEVIIVEISYTDDYSKYHFRTIRGTLY